MIGRSLGGTSNHKELPAAGQYLELVLTMVLKCETRTGYEIGDRSGHQHLVRGKPAPASWYRSLRSIGQSCSAQLAPPLGLGSVSNQHGGAPQAAGTMASASGGGLLAAGYYPLVGRERGRTVVGQEPRDVVPYELLRLLRVVGPGEGILERAVVDFAEAVPVW